jgi:hypothetical protein
VADGAVLLDPPVVTDRQHGPVVRDERTTNRHAALISADPGLIDGVLQAGAVAVEGVHWSSLKLRCGDTA